MIRNEPITIIKGSRLSLQSKSKFNRDFSLSRSFLLIDLESIHVLEETRLVVPRQGRVREIAVLHAKSDGEALGPL